jgi:putative ABC transport system permease protein
MPEWIEHLRPRLAALRLSPTREAEIIEELSQHLDQRYEELRAAGASDGEARRLAIDELRGPDALAHQMRTLRQARVPESITPGAPGGRLLDDLGQDLRYAARVLMHAPRFTVPALLALALGIGATSAVFSVVRGVMLKPLPYRDPERIVSVWEANVSRNQLRGIVAPANFVEWRERNRSFDYLGMVGPARLNVQLNGLPYEIEGMQASADVFAALGSQPALGRAYSLQEDLRGNDAVIVLSHAFWQTRLGGRSDVLGSTLNADGRLRTVVGVMAREFMVEGRQAEFYVPYGWTTESLRATPGRGISHAVARLREGVSLEQATEEMKTIAAQLEREAPRRNAGRSVALVPIHELTIETVKPALMLLSGAVALVLLIACVNVANLLLARSTVRQRELGLRSALGAERRRLLRQMLTESLVLAAAGGGAGLLLAVVLHRGLLALVADRIPVPRLDEIALDLPVVGFTIAVALGTGLVFGLVPALLATSNADDALREGGRQGTGPRSRRALAALVVAEVALSLVLLTGAGLLIRSFMRLQNVDPGFRPAGLLTARVTLPTVRYPEERQTAEFFKTALARIEPLPGVQSAAGISFLPLSGPGMSTGFYRLDQPRPADGQVPSTEVRPVTPRFFHTMGIPLLAGRDFTPADTAQSPLVAVVSEGLVKRHIGNEDPIGKRLHVNIGRAEGMQVEVVGVVGDVKFASLDAETRPAIYIPHTQLAIGLMTFVVRTELDPMSLTNSIGASVHAIDAELPLAGVRTMEEVVDATLARPRAVSVLLTLFALMALALAAVGVYGVMAYSVSQRTREIGVRMALGASAASVFRLVLGQALRLIAVGVVVGMLAAGALTRLFESLLFQTAALDPLTFAATALVLVSVAALASYLPARRGTKVDPLVALHFE